MTRDVNLDGFTTTGNIRDGLVSALKTIEYEHHEIHEGNFYTASVATTALGSGATLSLGANIPSDTFAHFRFTASAGGAAIVQLLEDSTISSGTATSMVNANRNASSAPFSALANPDIVGGDVLLQYVVASGTGPKAGGGVGGVLTEFVTKESETYVITLKNKTAGAYLASIDVGFYFTTAGTT